MGHRADSARSALGRTLLLLLGFVAACGPRPATEPGREATMLVVAVTGLRADDPLLDQLPASVDRSPDAFATGAGAAAVLELLDGRTALEHLRETVEPLGWARVQGWTTRVDILDPSVRSEPEWVHANLSWHFAQDFPGLTEADLHVVVVPRDRLDPQQFAALFERQPVVVVGIPELPDLRDDAEEVLARFRVPVLGHADEANIRAARTLGDVLAPLRGEVRRPAERVAHWWDSRGGGVVIERPGAWVVGGKGRTSVSIGEAVEAAETVDAALVAGSLLVLVRGSEAADLTSIEILTSSDVEWTEWGLEPIDTVHHPSMRYVQLDLAAEPEGDGILLADAHRKNVDIRLLVPLEDAPMIGTPIRDAASGLWLGFDGIRIIPWSRNYWLLTRHSSFDTDAWWPRAGAGIHLLWVHEGTGPPAPVLFED